MQHDLFASVQGKMGNIVFFQENPAVDFIIQSLALQLQETRVLATTAGSTAVLLMLTIGMWDWFSPGISSLTHVHHICSSELPVDKIAPSLHHNLLSHWSKTSFATNQVDFFLSSTLSYIGNLWKRKCYEAKVKGTDTKRKALRQARMLKRKVK